ncbi:MAG: hypothetical protein EXR11_07395 [Rhodospirillaceae bacterium]|nr:hypothetical protein [Rhodospirillaceae bacterium]
MRALTHNRLEIVETYADVRRPIDADNLDQLVADLTTAMTMAGQRRFGRSVELLLHVERREGRGIGPAVRVSAMTARLGAWLPLRQRLRTAAQDIAARGQMFARDMLAALTKLTGSGRDALVRTELRRKAPGKLIDLFDRIEPARMLKVERFENLAAHEREWLSDEIANLRRAVHSEAIFAQLMKRLRQETQVPFLPVRIADLKTLQQKLVGVPVNDAHLQRRRHTPRFVGVDRGKPIKVIAVKTVLDSRGSVRPPQYFCG